MPFLYLGHGVLALGALFITTAGSPSEEDRARARRVIALLGCLLSLVLFLLRHTDVSWRTTTVVAGPAAAAGLATASAWLLFGIAKREGRHLLDGALIGCASSALVLFALNRWVVPALLFWLAGSLAIAALVEDHDHRLQVWLTLACSDVLVVAALVLHANAGETWLLPASATETTSWLLVGAALLRSGSIPRVGAWGAGASPALPLLAGGSLALLTGIADREQPWLGLAVVVATIGIGIWMLRSKRILLAVLGAWPVATMFGLLLVVPGAPWQAAAAALLGLTSVLLWPETLGRARAERGYLIALVPISVGFSALVAAAAASFEEATATPEVLSAAPWTAVSALLPVMLALGVALGARLGRLLEPERYEPSSVIALWFVFALALAGGLWPRFVSGDAPHSARVFFVHLLAVAVAVVVARWFPHVAQGSRPRPPGEQLELDLSVVAVPGAATKVVSWAALGLGAAVVVTIAWISVRGLRVGFL